MKLIQITSQIRRDFRAIYKCENCDEEATLRGYDDRNFHDNVAPKIKCKTCGKTSVDIGVKSEFVSTKYPEGFQI